MKRFMLAALMAVSVTTLAEVTPGAEQGELSFEDQKTAILEVMDIEAGLVTELRSCIEAAADEALMRNCLTSHVAAMQEAMLHRFSVERNLR